MPAGDHRSIKVLTAMSARHIERLGLVFEIKRRARATQRGNSAVLTMNPIVPYFNAQRYQNKPEQSESVAEMDAATRGAPINRDAANIDEGTPIHSRVAMMMLYTVST
jgi:hypothetical protein